jgi:hypothetical protein
MKILKKAVGFVAIYPLSIQKRPAPLTVRYKEDTCLILFDNPLIFV